MTVQAQLEAHGQHMKPEAFAWFHPLQHTRLSPHPNIERIRVRVWNGADQFSLHIVELQEGSQALAQPRKLGKGPGGWAKAQERD